MSIIIKKKETLKLTNNLAVPVGTVIGTAELNTPRQK